MTAKRLIPLGVAALALLIVTPATQAFPGVREVAPAGAVARPSGPIDGGGGTCWSKELERSEGVWPYAHRLYLYTVWCGGGGLITYRSSAVRTSHDPLCWNTFFPQLAKTAGGAGWSLVEVQAWTEVECHSVPVSWPRYHDSLMMRVRYFPNGVYQTVAWD